MQPVSWEGRGSPGYKKCKRADNNVVGAIGSADDDRDKGIGKVSEDLGK